MLWQTHSTHFELGASLLPNGAAGGRERHRWASLRNRRPPEGAGMTYDAALHDVVLFGGQDNNGYFNDSWQLNSTSAPTPTPTLSATPAPRVTPTPRPRPQPRPRGAKIGVNLGLS